MNSNGTMIPIVEDDMGEGCKEVLNENMTDEEVEFEQAAMRRENLKVSQEKFTRAYLTAMRTADFKTPILPHLLRQSRGNR